MDVIACSRSDFEGGLTKTTFNLGIGKLFPPT